jgi:DNA-directed RNA polymerase specialized sigma24 family protein
MIAIVKASTSSATNPTAASNNCWKDRFERLLPAIVRHARRYVKNLSPDAAEEAVQEAVATAFVAYARLVKLGKEDSACAGPLARFAVRRACSGRTIAGSVNVNDVSSRWCEIRRGIRGESLDRQEGHENWREIVVQDRRATPAEIAITRIDFQAWLSSLPGRQRKIAEVLATGEGTKQVARHFGLTAGRVSQLRRSLHRSWCLLQGETART